MKQSLVKLVDVILKQLEEHPEVRHTESGIRNWLAREGYQKRDIDAVMKLMRPHFATTRRVEEYRPVALRRLTPHEEAKLSPAARDALVRLDLYGLVRPDERELILERINQFDGEVGLEELDWLLSWLVCSCLDYESQQTLYSVLDGERGTYH